MSIFKHLHIYDRKQDSLFYSCNVDLTRNAGNCLFKIQEIKSTLFSYFTNKMWKLDSGYNSPVNLVIIR